MALAFTNLVPQLCIYISHKELRSSDGGVTKDQQGFLGSNPGLSTLVLEIRYLLLPSRE